MLIDARHPEETRVTIVNGNRVEEFDFETATKKQLKGNIYLAKVTRVEPSLQAAFVEYGGNRHGFLPFSEIHPDYYQIPVEDREAIMAEELDAALRGAEEEDAEAEKASKKPKRTRKPRKDSKSTRSRTKKVKSDEEKPSDDKSVDEKAAEKSDDKPAKKAKDKGSDEEKEIKKPKRAPRRSKKSDAKDKADEKSDDKEKADKNSDKKGTIKAEVEDTDIQVVEVKDTDAEPDAKNDSKDKDDDNKEKKPKRTRRPRKSAQKANEEKDESDKNKEEDTSDDASNDKKPTDEVSKDLEDQVSSLDAGDDEEEDDDNDEDEGEIKDQIRRRQLRALKRRYKIQEVIKRGQVILIQVVKEERGNKGAALTSYLSIPGRYCVLMPNTTNGGGISRKIANHRDRKQLKSIMSSLSVPAGMGCIIRTAGLKRTKTEIKRDFDYLIRIWNDIRNLTLESVAPATIYNEGNLIKRSIRDLYGRNIDEILVEGEEGFKTAKDFMGMLMPTHAKKVVHYKNNIPLYQRYQVETQLESMFNPVVTLKSGGYLVINPTEALIAIDVNSGKATRQHNIEETAIATNLEAAAEIGRQLRLRDMAGLVVVDFIDMENRGNNRKLENAMKDALKTDRARVQVGRISSLGLMEMSRQRLRPNLVENSTKSCPHCNGTGRIRSVESSALLVMRALEEEGIRGRSSNLKVSLASQICIYLLNQKRENIMELESRFGLNIHIEPNDTIISPNYEIERSGNSRNPDDFVQAFAPVTSESVAIDEPEIEEEVSTEKSPEKSPEKSEEERPSRGRSRRRRNRGSRNRNHQNQNSEHNKDQENPVEGAEKSADKAEGDTENKNDGDGENKGRQRRGSRRSRYHTSNHSRRDRNDGENDTDNKTDTKVDDASPGDAEKPSSDKSDIKADVKADDTSSSEPKHRGRSKREDVKKAESKAELKAEVKAEPKTKVKTEPKKEEPKVDTSPRPEPKPVTKSDPSKPKKKGWWSRVVS
jgi:ribonuclease E